MWHCFFKRSGVAALWMKAFSADSVRNENFLFFAFFHETLFFVMKISLYWQFLITGLFWIMKISRTWQFFIIIHQTRLAFIMNISWIVEKNITSRQHRPALKKKIVRNCQYQEIFITKNKLKKEKWWKSAYIRKYSFHIKKTNQVFSLLTDMASFDHRSIV